MIDQPETQLLGDQPLKGLQFGIDEFDDAPCFHIDEVVMVRLWRGFIAGPTIAEIVAVEYAGLLEQPDRAIDRGDGNARVSQHRPLVELFHVGVVLAFRQDLRDHPALFGYPETTFGAEGFNIDRLMHGISVETKATRRS